MALQAELTNCQRCRLAVTRSNPLAGEGSAASRLMLIALAPGKKEDKEGRMFIGPSGPLIDELLQAAGLKRDDIYMTNLVKCHLPGNRRPKQDEVDTCSRYVTQEIAIIRPDVLVPLGHHVTRHILKRYHAPRHEARADFKNLYGKLFLFSDQKIFPLPHPSALLYNRSFKTAVRVMYHKLQALSRPCKWYPLCPLRRLYERGQLKPYWIEMYCQGDWEGCLRYQMEERGEYHPDTLLPDGTYLKISAPDKEPLGRPGPAT